MGLSRYQRVAFLINEYYRLKNACTQYIIEKTGSNLIGVTDIELDGDTETLVVYYDYYSSIPGDDNILSDCSDVPMDELDDFFN